MRFRGIGATALVVAATALAFTGSASVPSTVTTAEAGQRCINLDYGGTRYVFYKEGIRCRRAKRWARRVHRTEGRWEPRRYDCNSGTNFRRDGACERSRRKFFLWYPEH